MPSTVLAVSLADRAALAVDIGGTKLEVGVVGSGGGVLRRARTPTPTDGDDIWRALAGLVDELGLDGAEVCGVGTGGPMSAGGETVTPLNIPGWQAFPLRRRLAELTGLPVFVDNDAKALALAEGRWGAAAGVHDFLAMVVSTGVGGGIVLDGRLLDGSGGNAGHVGHVIVDPDGALCGCGARGCLEAMASGSAIERRFGISAVDASAEVVAEVGRLVGRGVASVCNLLDLRLAVVAGSVALGYGEPFFAAAQAELDARSRISFAAGARVVPAGLGADGPLAGAAMVGFRGASLL